MVIYPNTGALFVAGTVRTALAASKLRLFKNTGLIPGPGTVLADLTAIEADYSGYTAGGITIANFLTPLLDAAGGASIQSGLQQFAVVAPDPPAEIVGNVIGGWFLVTSGGVLLSVGTFPNGVPMAVAGQGLPINVSLLYGTLNG